MIKTKEEIISSIKAKIGESVSDEDIAILEDVTDTLSDYEAKAKGDGIDWKAKCEQVEKEWKQKYIDRFESTEPFQKEIGVPEPQTVEVPKALKFEDLFEEEGE